MVAGWGDMVGSQSVVKVAQALQKAEVPIVDNATCNASMAYLAGPIDDRRICAGLSEGGVDSCNGDSGGPLLLRLDGTRWVSCRSGFFLPVRVLSRLFRRLFLNQLRAAFEAGDDVHTAVAARTWEVDPEDVTPELRSRAKMVAYGLAYGMEAYGLSQRLGIPVDEASEILDGYFVAFPAVREYMDRTVAEARQKGYTETLFGRRRRIPELSSPNYNVRLAGERQAMNAAIQGLAADVFKVALIRIDRGLRDAGATTALVLQVHDEVILEVPPDELSEVEAMVRAEMTGAYELRVELAVEVAVGTTWDAAKG